MLGTGHMHSGINDSSAIYTDNIRKGLKYISKKQI